jgi:hypothetical protein
MVWCIVRNAPFPAICKGAGSKVKKSQPHNYYRKESIFENLSNAKQRVSLLSVF